LFYNGDEVLRQIKEQLTDETKNKFAILKRKIEAHFADAFPR